MSDNTSAVGIYKQMLKSYTLSGIMLVLKWLLESSTVLVTLDKQPKGRLLAILHKDADPKDDEFITIDIRVLGGTVLMGYIQLL